MELRIYYNKRPIEARLTKNEVKSDAEDGRWPVYSDWGGFRKDGESPRLVYFTLTSTIEPLPELAKGLKVVRLSLHAMLALEQNRDVKQGTGKLGDSHYEVEYGTEKFHPPSSDPNSFSEAYRPVVRIWVRGTNFQSILDCYKKIREGNSDSAWKGTAVATVGAYFEPEHPSTCDASM